MTQNENCHDCGGSLDMVETCVICDKPYLFQCSLCYHWFDDPAHTDCLIQEKE